MRVSTGVMAMLFAWSAAAAEPSALTPVGPVVDLGDPARFTILLPETPTAQEAYAARLLADYAARVYGAVLPVATTAEPPFLSVGETDAARRAGLVEALPEQGYSLRVAEGNLFVRGGAPGPLNGVLALLEEDWGCRWYTLETAAPNGLDPALTVLPDRAGDSLAVTPREFVPPFAMREILYIWGMAQEGEWPLVNRLASISWHTGLPPESGARLASGYFIHTYPTLLPPDEYYDAHPEYYALQGGKRVRMTHYEGSVCYSHPEVPRLMADKIRAALVENPTLRLFSVSIPDSGIVQCECPECAARIARVGAGVQVELANRVADELAPDYPDIRITVLAYGVDPSAAVKVHPNVVVFYAPIAARWNRIKMLVPLGEDPAVVPQLAAWQKTAERLFFWDYIDLIEPPQPYPNLDPFAEGLRFLASQGVRGYFADCTTAGGSLAPLKKWVFTKLTWNPSLDLDALIAEFLSAYYGDAASAMAAYTEVQRGAWRRYIAGFRAGDPPSGFDFTPEELDRMRRALADAAARAEENPSLGSSHK